MFLVNEDLVEKVVRAQPHEKSNAVLDAVDDFCEFIKSVNKEAKSYAEKHKSTSSGQEAYFQKKYKKKYTYDW